MVAKLKNIIAFFSFFFFKGIYIPFSVVAVSIYIPANRESF